MMRVVIWILAIAASLYCAAPLVAQQQPADCERATTEIVYGNGVWNVPVDSVGSMKKLEQALQASLPEPEFRQLKFHHAYNPTDGLLADVLETTIQLLSLDYTRFWRIITNVEPMPDSIRDAVLPVLAKGVAAEPATPLAQHVSFYKRLIANGTNVVLVAHSQGNLFANLAYDALTAAEQQRFRIVSVANPASFVAGDGPYVTTITDEVIRE